jgi:hypothetical protein
LPGADSFLFICFHFACAKWFFLLGADFYSSRFTSSLSGSRPLFPADVWFFFDRRKAMCEKIRCAAPDCKRLFIPNPRVKNQLYCGEKDCQRARRRKWQKEKLATDPDYKADQADRQREWRQLHPGYYKEYRQAHPANRQRNSLLQRYRNARARVIAKMDAFKPAPIKEPGVFYLLPLIAKMDASAQKIFLIPVAYNPPGAIAKGDSIGFRDLRC